MDSITTSGTSNESQELAGQEDGSHWWMQEFMPNKEQTGDQQQQQQQQWQQHIGADNLWPTQIFQQQQQQQQFQLQQQHQGQQLPNWDQQSWPIHAQWNQQQHIQQQATTQQQQLQQQQHWNQQQQCLNIPAWSSSRVTPATSTSTSQSASVSSSSRRSSSTRPLRDKVRSVLTACLGGEGSLHMFSVSGRRKEFSGVQKVPDWVWIRVAEETKSIGYSEEEGRREVRAVLQHSYQAFVSKRNRMERLARARLAGEKNRTM